MKLTLRPNARTKLRELRCKADTVAQQPVVPMTQEETRTLLNSASIIPFCQASGPATEPDMYVRVPKIIHSKGWDFSRPLDGDRP